MIPQLIVFITGGVIGNITATILQHNAKIKALEAKLEKSASDMKDEAIQQGMQIIKNLHGVMGEDLSELHDKVDLIQHSVSDAIEGKKIATDITVETDTTDSAATQVSA